MTGENTDMLTVLTLVASVASVATLVWAVAGYFFKLKAVLDRIEQGVEEAKNAVKASEKRVMDKVSAEAKDTKKQVMDKVSAEAKDTKKRVMDKVSAEAKDTRVAVREVRNKTEDTNERMNQQS